MIAASLAEQRPTDARLLVVDGHGTQREIPRRDFASLLRDGDLVVANDAATLPASLAGRHAGSGAQIEVRLAAARSLDVADNPRFAALVFGAGDYRTRTEDRPPPPPLAAADALALGPITATVERILDHPRLVELRLEGSSEEVWAAIAHHGRPIQYAHVPTPLAAWDVWTPIAAAPPRVRGAVGRLHARLALARGAARSRRGFRHYHARRGHLVHRRSAARCAAAVR